MSPNLKILMNQAFLENGVFEQIVTHFENELGLDGFGALYELQLITMSQNATNTNTCRPRRTYHNCRKTGLYQNQCHQLEKLEKQKKHQERKEKGNKNNGANNSIPNKHNNKNYNNNDNSINNKSNNNNNKNNSNDNKSICKNNNRAEISQKLFIRPLRLVGK